MDNDILPHIHNIFQRLINCFRPLSMLCVKCVVIAEALYDENADTTEEQRKSMHDELMRVTDLLIEKYIFTMGRSSFFPLSP